eukprot:780617-Rhodomonas_salina.1
MFPGEPRRMSTYPGTGFTGVQLQVDPSYRRRDSESDTTRAQAVVFIGVISTVTTSTSLPVSTCPSDLVRTGATGSPPSLSCTVSDCPTWQVTH